MLSFQARESQILTSFSKSRPVNCCLESPHSCNFTTISFVAVFHLPLLFWWDRMSRFLSLRIVGRVFVFSFGTQLKWRQGTFWLGAQLSQILTHGMSVLYNLRSLRHSHSVKHSRRYCHASEFVTVYPLARLDTTACFVVTACMENRIHAVE